MNAYNVFNILNLTPFNFGDSNTNYLDPTFGLANRLPRAGCWNWRRASSSRKGKQLGSAALGPPRLTLNQRYRGPPEGVPFQSRMRSELPARF